MMKYLIAILFVLVGSLDVRSQELTGTDYEEIHCLAQNIYHEARGESMDGKFAVAFVTINRTNDEYFPDTVCNVVYQTRYKNDGSVRSCQFSWTCNAAIEDEVFHETDQWIVAWTIAYLIYTDWVEIEDLTDGSLYYHAKSVNPRWTKSLNRTMKIGAHIFYK